MSPTLVAGRVANQIGVWLVLLSVGLTRGGSAASPYEAHALYRISASEFEQLVVDLCIEPTHGAAARQIHERHADRHDQLRRALDLLIDWQRASEGHPLGITGLTSSDHQQRHRLGRQFFSELATNELQCIEDLGAISTVPDSSVQLVVRARRRSRMLGRDPRLCGGATSTRPDLSALMGVMPNSAKTPLVIKLLDSYERTLDAELTAIEAHCPVLFEEELRSRRRHIAREARSRPEIVTEAATALSKAPLRAFLSRSRIREVNEQSAASLVAALPPHEGVYLASQVAVMSRPNLVSEQLSETVLAVVETGRTAAPDDHALREACVGALVSFLTDFERSKSCLLAQDPTATACAAEIGREVHEWITRRIAGEYTEDPMREREAQYLDQAAACRRHLHAAREGLLRALSKGMKETTK